MKMKTIINNIYKVLIIVAAMSTIHNVSAQETKNYVKTYVAKESIQTDLKAMNDLDSAIQSIAFYDGLGRPTQQIALGGSPTQLDVISETVYDGLGRTGVNYLPYTAETNGLMQKNFTADQLSFYSTGTDHAVDTHPFAVTQFESSPLNRPVEQGSPGTSWQPGGNAITYSYELNTGADQVLDWEINETTGLPISSAAYAANRLRKQIVLDEDNISTLEFTDKLGRTILKRAQVHENGDANQLWADTYYIYDNAGQLRVVLPPEASKRIAAEFSGKSDAEKSTFLNTWAFIYTYDARKRMITKKVPGAEYVRMVYDRWDRLVLTQDGNQRDPMTGSGVEWTYTKYDLLNRPIMTGIVNDDAGTLSSLVETSNARFESLDGTDQKTQYSNQSQPKQNVQEVLTVTYYDNYDYQLHTSWNGLNLSFNDPENEMNPHNHVRGQVTGSMVKTGDGNWIRGASYYDHKYRLIQMQSTNHLNGKDVSTNYYDFEGKVTRSIATHNDGSNTTTIKRRFTYDHAGRMMQTWHQINNEEDVLLVSNSYNELGELSEKDLKAGAQSVDYTYNIRGWLTSINDAQLSSNGDAKPDLFGMNLYYADAAGLTNQSSLYNGNISAMRWSDFDADSSGIATRSYTYAYDGLNRLKTASHFENNASINKYSVSGLTYDLNGNIEILKRSGAEENSFMDDLNYDYVGNQLQYVNDLSSDSLGFDNNGTGTAIDYAYDANGNLTKDENKDISSISYNHLNLPVRVDFENGDYITYLYDAAGIKLKQTVYSGGSVVKETDYVGEFIYETIGDGARELQLIQHEEGRVVFKENDQLVTVPDYQYHLKDHLGNVRLTFSTTPEEYNRSASFEDSELANEVEEFSGIDTPNRVPHPKGGKGARLNNTAPTGPLAVLSVNKGDTVSLSVDAYYEGGNGYSNAIGDQVLIDALSGSLKTSTTLEGAVSPTSIDDGVAAAIALLGVGGSDDDQVPGAYLNYLVFDRNMEYQGIVGFIQISSAANMNEERIALDDIPIDRDGYLVAYLSNESNASAYVYFDDFTVEHTKTNVVQTDNYYPFGLTYNSYSRTASQTNFMNTFQDQEYEEETGWVKFKWRNHQPEIGRFFNVDPLAEDYHWWTPYAFSGNMLTAHRELEGLEPWSINYETGMVYPASDYHSYPIDEGSVWLGNPDAEFEAGPETEILLGLTPAGVAVDVYDFGTAMNEGDGLGMVLAGVGFVPVVGDLAKIIGKGAREALQATAGETTTIIGRLTDTQRLTGELSNVKNGMNVGGFNILDQGQFWSLETNMTWLQRAVNRGDVIKAASDPTDLNNIFKNGVDGKKTVYGQEIEYLKDQGYRYDSETQSFILDQLNKADGN